MGHFELSEKKFFNKKSMFVFTCGEATQVMGSCLSSPSPPSGDKVIF